MQRTWLHQLPAPPAAGPGEAGQQVLVVGGGPNPTGPGRGVWSASCGWVCPAAARPLFYLLGNGLGTATLAHLQACAASLMCGYPFLPPPGNFLGEASQQGGGVLAVALQAISYFISGYFATGGGRHALPQVALCGEMGAGVILGQGSRCQLHACKEDARALFPAH